MTPAMTLDDAVRKHTNVAQVKDKVEKTENFYGRIVHHVQNALIMVVSKVYLAVCTILQVLNGIRGNTSSFNTVLRGLENGLQILQLYGHRIPANLLKITPVINLIDVLGTSIGIYYFASGEWKNDTHFIRAAVAFLTLADMGGAILWLGELGVPLDKVVHAIGNLRFFGFISSIPVGPILTGFVGIGFTFIGLDGVYRFYKLLNVSKEDNPRIDIDRRQAVIDVAWASVEVAGKISLIASAVFPGFPVLPILLLGLAAAGFGTTSLVHNAVFA